MSIEAARPACLFAHFDAQGRIAPHVLHYLAALDRCGYRVAMACSGPAPDEASLAAARAAGVAAVCLRANAGLDFGAWQQLLRDGHADGAPAVLLANDSVFGPFWDLRDTLRDIMAGSVDAWGMVESRQRGWHLQSWFVHLDAALLGSRAVRTVLAQPFPRMTKEEVILHGEIGLGAAFRAEGARVGAAWTLRDGAWMSWLRPTNPMHLDWRSMLLQRRVPFLKVELLRDDPMHIPWLGLWRDTLAQVSGFSPAWIDAHLRLDARRPPPGRPLGLLGHALYAVATRDHAVASQALWRHLLARTR